MSAGGSQAVQAVQAALSSVWSRRRSRERDATGRHLAGCQGEREVCRALSTLALAGYQHLDDRRLRDDPTSRANVDHLVVGPSGVYVVDAKNWAGQVEVDGGRLVQSGAVREPRLIAMGWLTGRVEDALVHAGHDVAVQGVLCFTRRQPRLGERIGQLLVTDVAAVAPLLSGRPTVLSPDEVAAVAEVLAYAFPPYDVSADEVAEAEGLLFGDSETRDAGMSNALEAPLQEWMAWLHPEQAPVVRRSFAGPARIRGSAGTGKTVVALHRLAWLASTRPGRFLLTSYAKVLPVVLAPTYRTLSPSTADRVDFLNLHVVALDVLRQRGQRLRVDPGNTAFNTAWPAHAQALADTGLSKDYFREEVDRVLKGRDVRTLEDYLALERVGRGTPLREVARRAIWQLRLDYDAQLAVRGQADFMDVLRLARDEVRARPYEKWTGVVVDEVQDVPMVGLQLLHALAGGDRPDGLLLVGDGQQTIYPGGFRLSEAGVSVAGRAVVLHRNHRNTVEILAAAQSVIAGDDYEDLDARPQPGERPVEVVRHGPLPTGGRYDTLAEHDQAMLWDLQALGDRHDCWSGTAVLCETNALVARYATLLERAGVPTVRKDDWGRDVDAVRVGTWHSSKGLEFVSLFLPQVDRATRAVTGAGAAAREEKAALQRRVQFVAITRARDEVWIGRLRAA